MNTAKLIKELNFEATRSSGAGGQHVNKVSSKIELFFDLENSTEFSEEEKILLLKNLANRLTKENMLILTCDENRSQHKNKELAIKRFIELIQHALIVPKKRRPTKPSIAAIRKKAENKRKQTLKKSMPKKPKVD